MLIFFNKAGKIKEIIVSIKAVIIRVFKIGLAYSRVIIGFPVILFTFFELIVITSVIKI